MYKKDKFDRKTKFMMLNLKRTTWATFYRFNKNSPRVNLRKQTKKENPKGEC